MKIAVEKAPRYIVDAKGKRVSVVLGLKTYRRLMEAWEDLEDQRTYDKAAPQVHAECARGECVTLEEFLAGRRTK